MDERRDHETALSTPPGERDSVKDVPSRRRDTRVLIVDDASTFRRAARELLERRGYLVVGEADSAARALELADRLSPDAVLLDVRLPDGTGFEVAAALSLADPPPAVLLTSTDINRESHSLSERSGARGFVAKAQLAAADLTRFWPSA